MFDDPKRSKARRFPRILVESPDPVYSFTPENAKFRLCRTLSFFFDETSTWNIFQTKPYNAILFAFHSLNFLQVLHCSGRRCQSFCCFAPDGSNSWLSRYDHRHLCCFSSGLMTNDLIDFDQNHTDDDE